MSDQNRSIEGKIQHISEYNQKLNIQKLEVDEHGRLLLDPINPHHVEWYEDIELISDEYR